MPDKVWWVVTVLIGLATSVIGYFLKGVHKDVDGNTKAIQNIRETYATKEDIKDVKSEINSDLKKLSADIEEIKDRFLPKDDFIRLQTRMEDKIDKIYYRMMNGGFQE